MNPSERIFTRLSFMPNFNAKRKGVAENILYPIEKWSLLFFNDILNDIIFNDIILKYTNQEIEQKCNDLNRIYDFQNTLDMPKLTKNFYQLLYYEGWIQVNIYFYAKIFQLKIFGLFSPYFE